ncbi:hypothetical protein [Ruegeria profundi]|uniref:hypothetical protein n=1 Tax=Ruegeria profundi TaxID=1685378 RepID=UPI001CD2DB3A|nr:hypothetical protein [Ruegeria profundi]MCA0927146.1 hypothetical protein [Ruegeria profundi]
MNARPAFHVEHFTGVVGRMNEFDHFRRNLITCIGFHLLSGNGKTCINPQISSAGIKSNRKPSKQISTCAIFMARGSDALTDSGSVDDALEALHLNPLDWTFVHHTLHMHETFDGLNDLNARTSNWARELVQESIIEDPTDFAAYKITGLMLADTLNTNRSAKRQLAALSNAPLTIDGAYIHNFVATADELAGILGKAKHYAKDAFSNRRSVRLQ